MDAGVDASWGDLRRRGTLVRWWIRSSTSGASVESTPSGMTVMLGHPDEIFTEIRARGRSLTIRSDDLGYGTAFYWQGDGIAAAATRPELIAAVAEAAGTPLARDRCAAEDLATVGWLPPERTGYVALRALRCGESATLDAGDVTVVTDTRVAAWVSAQPVISPADLVERTAATLTEAVAATLDGEAPVYADLTAGRDSRLVLAALLALDAQHDVVFQTVGDPDLADVDAARQLCAHLGVTHRSGYFAPFSLDPYGDRLQAHVEYTAGVCNAMDGLREPFEPVHETRISGLGGEVVRGWRTHAPRTGQTNEREAAAIIDRFGAGSIDLLKPGVADQVRGSAAAALVSDEISPWMTAHRYYAEVRLRGRMTRVDDFTAEVRRYPLLNPELRRLGAATMCHHPGLDLASAVIEHLHPGLDSIDITPPPAGETTLMQRALAEQATERTTALREIRETDSAAWEVIDRDTFGSALEGGPSAPPSTNRLLYGAAGGVLWLRR